MKKRLINPTSVIAIATVAVASVTASQAVTIVSAAGYTITHDGNMADHNLDAGGSVPSNLALTNGTPFASQDPSPHDPIHAVVKLNDGNYGNSFSHINGAGPNPGHMGILLNGTFELHSFAFGRDNQPNFGDRSDGTYNIEFTADGGSNWTPLGDITLSGEAQRIEYDIELAGGGAIVGNGLRIFATTEKAIDEIEIYGVIPEPSGLALLGLALGGFVLRRRR